MIEASFVDDDFKETFPSAEDSRKMWAFPKDGGACLAIDRVKKIPSLIMEQYVARECSQLSQKLEQYQGQG